ncbi:MAG: ion channel [Alphaproteobacteria bacterium]
MFEQLIIGGAIVSLTIVSVAMFVGIGIGGLKRMGRWLTKPPYWIKAILSLVAVTLWLLAALTAAVWIWAAAFIVLDLFETLEAALYFSVTAFTTLGFGDVFLPERWRLLAGICTANGLLLFGLITAFLIEFLTQLHKLQSKIKSKTEL